MMDFTAIDFETATAKPTSICSIGICEITDGEISKRDHMLIRPTPFEFNDFNISIHNITPEMVKDAPDFGECFEKIRPYIEGKTVIAHNAMFDVGIMLKTLDYFGIPYPEFNYLCTVKLSQLAYPELTKHRLNLLCDALGIKFSHHYAYDDAYACACVLLRIFDDYSLLSFEELEECFEFSMGHVYPGCHLKFGKHKRQRRKRTGAGAQTGKGILKSEN